MEVEMVEYFLRSGYAIFPPQDISTFEYDKGRNGEDVVEL